MILFKNEKKYLFLGLNMICMFFYLVSEVKFFFGEILSTILRILEIMALKVRFSQE